MLITYYYDSNAILARLLRSRKGSELAETMQETYEHLGARGFKPSHHMLDNETSSALKEYLKSMKVSSQLVPLHVHRTNAEERATRTFKNHVIEILCGLHKKFPLNLWCKH